MDAEDVGAWIDARAAEREFSGVALVWRDGAPVFAHAAGLAHRGHGVPVRVGTRFAVASVTKLVTAITALRMVARAELDLHRPVMEVLPAGWRPRALTPEHTLHHVLSHTSGLGNYHDTESMTWDSFLSCWDRVPTYHARGPADMVPLFVDAPATGPPGVRFDYQDVNFLLVGLMIEAVSGRRFADCASDEVLTPAGMTDTAFAQLDDEPANLATGYMVTDGPPETWRSSIFSVPVGGMPDGGMITTVTDQARLLDALEAGSLLPAELHAAMTSPQGPWGEEVEQYGYGCEVIVRDGTVGVIGHAGMDPGVSSQVWRYRASATTTVVLSNYDQDSWPVSRLLADAYGLDEPRP